MKKMDLKFAELELFDDHVVVRVADGIELDLCKYRQITEVLIDSFEKPFGLVIDVLHFHSFSFDVMLAMRDNENIICCAIVSYRPTTILSLAQSLRFFGKPGTFCGSVTDARFWVKERMVEWHEDSAA